MTATLPDGQPGHTVELLFRVTVDAKTAELLQSSASASQHLRFKLMQTAGIPPEVAAAMQTTIKWMDEDTARFEAETSPEPERSNVIAFPRADCAAMG